MKKCGTYLFNFIFFQFFSGGSWGYPMVRGEAPDRSRVRKRRLIKNYQTCRKVEHLKIDFPIVLQQMHLGNWSGRSCFFFLSTKYLTLASCHRAQVASQY